MQSIKHHDYKNPLVKTHLYIIIMIIIIMIMKSCTGIKNALA